MGLGLIWGSDFFRVLQTFNLSCVCCFIFDVALFSNIYESKKDENEQSLYFLSGGAKVCPEKLSQGI